RRWSRSRSQRLRRPRVKERNDEAIGRLRYRRAAGGIGSAERLRVGGLSRRLWGCRLSRSDGRCRGARSLWRCRGSRRLWVWRRGRCGGGRCGGRGRRYLGGLFGGGIALLLPAAVLPAPCVVAAPRGFADSRIIPGYVRKPGRLSPIGRQNFPVQPEQNSRLANLGKFGCNLLILRKPRPPIDPLGPGIRRYPVFVW